MTFTSIIFNSFSVYEAASALYFIFICRFRFFINNLLTPFIITLFPDTTFVSHTHWKLVSRSFSRLDDADFYVYLQWWYIMDHGARDGASWFLLSGRHKSDTYSLFAFPRFSPLFNACYWRVDGKSYRRYMDIKDKLRMDIDISHYDCDWRRWFTCFIIWHVS